MQSAQKKPGSKKPAKAIAGDANDKNSSLELSKQSLRQRIKALKKIIKQLSGEDKPKHESL